MVENSKDAVWVSFGLGVELVGLHGSGSVVAYLPGNSEPDDVVCVTGPPACLLRYPAAWFSRFVRMGGCEQ